MQNNYGYNGNGFNGYNGYGYNGYNRGPVFPYNNEYYLKKQQQRKGISAISMACGLSIVAFTLLSAVIGIIMQKIPTLFDAYSNNADFENTMYIVIILSTLFLPFYVAYRVLKKKSLASDLPLGRPYDKKEFFMMIPVTLMFCIIGSIFTGLLAEFFDTAFGVEFTMPEESTEYSSLLSIVIALVSTAVIPAIVEEFCIRGVVMQSLRRYGDAFAVIASAAVFGILHGNMIQIPFAFIAGLAIGYAVIRTGTMWTGVIVHFLNNGMAVAVSAIEENAGENAATVFSAVWSVTVFALGIISVIFMMKNNSKPFYCFTKGEGCLLKASEKASAFAFTIPAIAAFIVLCIETAMFIKT